MGGKLICTGSEDRTVIVWNPRAGTPQQHIKALHQSNVTTICSHPEAPIVVTGSEDSEAKVVHIETGRVLSTLGGHMESVEKVAFSNAPAGSLLLLGSAGMDGKLQIWGGKTTFKWLPHPYWFQLCTTSVDRTLRIFNALSGQCLQVLCGHKDTVLDLDLIVSDAPDAQGNAQVCVLSGSDDKTCKIFVKPLQANAESTSSMHTATPVVSPPTAEAKASGYSTGEQPPVAPAQAAMGSAPTSSPAA